MKSIFGSSPITTILGLVGAAVVALQNIFVDGTKPSIGQIISAVGIAVFAYFAGDKNKATPKA